MNCSAQISFALACSFLPLACENDENSGNDPLSINEIMPSNATTFADEYGIYSDWIELYNNSDKSVTLREYGISDRSVEGMENNLSESLRVAPFDVLLLWAGGDPTNGATHLPFKLNKLREQVFLYHNGSKIDEYAWTSAVADQSFAKFPDGTGEITLCNSPTPNSVNGEHCGE